MSETLKCPRCGHPLKTEQALDGVWVWCPALNCKSVRSNDGARGLTAEDAAEKLKKLIDSEEVTP